MSLRTNRAAKERRPDRHGAAAKKDPFDRELGAIVDRSIVTVSEKVASVLQTRVVENDLRA